MTVPVHRFVPEGFPNFSYKAVTPTGEMLGISGVAHWFLVSYDLPFEHSLSHLKTAVQRFTKKTSFSDDLTAVIFEVS
jgi:hypothetical protein